MSGQTENNTENIPKQVKNAVAWIKLFLYVYVNGFFIWQLTAASISEMSKICPIIF